ncbi:MAG: 3-methyl-2-oxobutanoate hydroxymethyltransferase [Spirochaetia bacterium]|nr:3-methyl-2-oxobutanoate hydroxymethyltransferase [Spirochaetia bacterium]
MKTITKIQDFTAKKQKGEKITVLTCYDYSMAKLLSKTSIDTVLVGDSLAGVFQGHKNTLPVTLDEMIYHAKTVRRGLPDAFITVDMPFLSFQISPEKTVKNAGRIMKEAQCDAVKLEGAGYLIETIKKLTDASIPVMGHLGLTPQSVLKTGGYKLQAKEKKEQENLIKDALAIEKAGCFAMVLEMIPADLAKEVSKKLKIPTIGIGAGAGADGQVLVINDLLGIDADFSPKFVRRYANLSEQIITSVENFCLDVRKKEFPGKKESF